MHFGVQLFLAVAPQELGDASQYGLSLAHMAYRVGGGPHLFRTNSPVPPRGGLMVIDDAGFDGHGDPAPFCQEVLRECNTRGFSGVVCGFDRKFPVLEQIVDRLATLLQPKGWPVFVPESFGSCSRLAHVLIPTGMSGGSLSHRLREAQERHGANRVALALERSAQDFRLPAPSGMGIALSPSELEALLERLDPSVYFSSELCANYFTYMSRPGDAHFVLFDDPRTVQKKLQVAAGLGITQAILPYPDFCDLLPELI